MIKLSRRNKNEILSMLCIFSCIYPAVLIARTFFYNSEGLFSNLIINLLMLSVGYLIPYLVKRLKTLRFKKMVPLFSLLILITIGFIKFSSEGFERIGFEVVMGILFYLIGNKIRNNIFSSFIFDHKFKIGVFIFPATLILSLYNKDFLVLKPYILTLTYLFIGIFILQRNENKLEWAFNQNGVDAAAFSTKIRSYNGRLSLLVFAIIVMLSNIKALKEVFEFCLRTLAVGFSKLILLISYLISLLFAKTQGTPPQGQKGLTEMIGTQKPSLAGLIQDILIKAVVMYIIYKLLPVIWRKLRLGVVLLIKYLKKLITNWKQNQVENNDEYVDSSEILQLSINRKEKSILKQKKRNKEKDFNKITDPIERIRCIYRILLEKIQFKRVVIKNSDTTGEIYAKALKIDGIKFSFKDITDIYNVVRYKEEAPGVEEIEKAEMNFSVISDIIKKYK